MMIFHRKRVEVPKWTPTQAGRSAVAALKNSHYCEHGDIRTFCSQPHVGWSAPSSASS
jgi:hypothetical protein